MALKLSLTLHPKQMEVFRSKSRFRVVVAGRRWGKTALSRVLIITKARVAKRKIWYVAPTYKMAKNIMWLDILDAIPKRWIAKINETTLSITLINGTRIELKGADKADSLRGVGVDFLVLDEFQDMSEETWTKVLRPTLADRRGEAIFIGTPKAYNYLFDLYRRGQSEEFKDWESWQFPTITSPFIPLSEIFAARNDMGVKEFAQEFEACHLPDTEVKLWNGKVKQISQMVKGDLLCFLDDQGDVQQCEVLQVGITGAKIITDVVLENGDLVSASNHHKFKVHANE